MLNDLIQKGLLLSQNKIFQKYMGKAAGLLAKPVKLGILITTAYGKLVDAESQQNGFQQIKGVMQTFMRLVKAYSNGSYRNVATKSLVSGVAVLLYFVSPIDIIPDFIPALGLLDDLSIMAWFVNSFQNEILKFKEWEASHQPAPTPGTL